MQKLGFKQVIKTVALQEAKFLLLKQKLKKEGKTFSKWVREKIEEELRESEKKK